MPGPKPNQFYKQWRSEVGVDPCAKMPKGHPIFPIHGSSVPPQRWAPVHCMPLHATLSLKLSAQRNETKLKQNNLETVSKPFLKCLFQFHFVVRTE